MIFERFECYRMNSTKVLYKECSMTRTSRIGIDRINFVQEFVILQPLTNLHFEMMFYFKQQVYRRKQQSSGDLCRWLNEKMRSNLLDLTIGHMRHLIKYDHKLECPILEGNISAKANNISLNSLFPSVPFVPSGQYRVDAIISEGHQNIIFRARIYLAISDKRIEQYDNFDDLAKFENLKIKKERK